MASSSHLKDGFGDHPSPPEQSLEFIKDPMTLEGVTVGKCHHKACSAGPQFSVWCLVLAGTLGLQLQGWSTVLSPSHCAAFP